MSFPASCIFSLSLSLSQLLSLTPQEPLREGLPVALSQTDERLCLLNTSSSSSSIDYRKRIPSTTKSTFTNKQQQYGHRHESSHAEHLLGCHCCKERRHTANMNFSEPDSAANTSTSVNSSTPLHFARSLFSDIETPISISKFTRHLTAIRDAAYLLLLPQTCRAEVEFHHAETSRIANGHLGNDVLHASTLFFLNTFRRDAVDDTEVARMQNEDIYEATHRMLLDLTAEQDRYLDNMTLLLADMKEKWRLDLIETGSFVNPLFLSPPPCFPSLRHTPF